MNHKAQRIFNYYNANQNLIKRENKRIKLLKNTKASEQLEISFDNENKIENKINDDYDISNSNKRNIQISQKINMNFTNEQPNKHNDIDKFDINDVYNRNIRCLCNVYQQKYKNDINATGFGDFIRGCYFLFDFCDKFNIKLQIFINHSLNTFLKNKNI
jgi:hypothetical protein